MDKINTHIVQYLKDTNSYLRDATITVKIDYTMADGSNLVVSYSYGHYASEHKEHETEQINIWGFMNYLFNKSIL